VFVCFDECESASYVIEIFLGQAACRRDINIQFRDGLTRCVLDLILLLVSELDRQFVSCHGVASLFFCRKIRGLSRAHLDPAIAARVDDFEMREPG